MSAHEINEAAEARALSHAIDAALRGEPLSLRCPSDLDGVTAMLVSHTAALRAVSPVPPAAPVRHLRVVAARVAMAAACAACLALGVRFLPAPAPAPVTLRGQQMAMVMSMSMLPMMPATVPQVEAMSLPVAPPGGAAAAAPILPTATEVQHTYRVAGADVQVRAEPDATATVVMVIDIGATVPVTGAAVVGRGGERWFPVQVGAIRGFVPADALKVT